MAGDDGSALSGVTSQHVGLIAFGLVAVLFALLPATRSFVFAGLWLLAPVAAFGSLLQVLRGRSELRSGSGIIFAMICAGVAFVAIPVGSAIASPGVGEPVTFFGFLAAIVAVGFARLSVAEGGSNDERDIPPAEHFEPFAPDVDEPPEADAEGNANPPDSAPPERRER